ncbi:neuraminidase-like domain-containing protein [Streptomyces sp. NPDC053367]|uniref:neuraminidase-like domain-containing protein n=1 Tax=Streptomyces sp. NPDC053367 TaxID=3365700 RepID=UPI0037D3C23B
MASRHNRATRFHNAQKDLTGYFQQIPSYQDLFGGLDYLSCPHCRSVLSPAAYFVDLMRITDEHVTHPNMYTIPAGMTLEQRRPDLFSLPLNCENTDTELPYLRVVNEVLEQKLKLDLGTDVYPALALAPYPFNLPFNLPLQQIRGNLAALGATVAEVYSVLSAPLSAGLTRGGTAGTAVLASTSSARDGCYQDMELRLTAGPGAGQARRIARFDGSSRTAHVCPDWQIQPTAETGYEIRNDIDVERERLGLSLEQYHLYTTPHVAEADVAPLWGYQEEFSSVLSAFAPGSGRITVAEGSINVHGDAATRFGTGLLVGDQLWCGAEIRTVASITGPDSLTVDHAWSAHAQNAAYQVARWPKGDGAVTVHKGSSQVTGEAGTHFERLTPGDQLQCAGQIRTVVEIRSSSALLVDSPWHVDAVNALHTVNQASRLDRMTTFLDRTGLSRSELDALFRQDTSPREFESGVSRRFFINATGEGLPPLQLVTDRGDPGNPFERVVGLSVKRLDRLGRFIRLQRTLGWSASDMDRVMASIGAEELNGPAIRAMAAVHRLVADGSLPIDVVTSFWGDLKTIGRRDEDSCRDLFDRVYNPPGLLRRQDPSTGSVPIVFDPARPLVWNIDDRTVGETNSAVRGRLLGALGVGDDNLTRTAHFVRDLQGRQDASLVLDLPTLSWLYRLVKQAAWSRLTVDDYFTLLWLLFYPKQPGPYPPPTGSVPLGIAATERVRDAVEWLRASPFDVQQLRYVISGTRGPGPGGSSAPDGLRDLIDSLAARARETRLQPDSFLSEHIHIDEAQVLFDGLVAGGFITTAGIATNSRPRHADLASLVPLDQNSFTVQGIDPAQSAQIFAELTRHAPPYIITAPGAASGVLSEAFTTQTSLDFLSPAVPLPPDAQREVREVLLQALSRIDTLAAVLEQAAVAQESLAEQGVAGSLGIDCELLRALLSFCAGQESLSPQWTLLFTPVEPHEEVPSAVSEVMAALDRGAVWAGALGFTAFEVAAAATNPRPFGIADTRVLDLAAIRTLEQYRRLTVAFDDRNGALLEYLRKPPAEGLNELAELTGWSLTQTVRLIDHLWPAGVEQSTSDTVEGVRRLKAAFDLCALTGTDAFLLTGLFDLLHLPVGAVGGHPDPAAWASYQTQAGRTLEALSSRYGDAFPEISGRLSSELDAAKRNAVLGRTIWMLRPQFPSLRTPTDLYQFLLIDTEMSDCATTSRIAQGISSVQLYLQRCRMNLEPGVDDLDIDPEWWEWLSTYRVWEANRKIFLYPENYLHPQLRSGRSPEFERLSQSLLQSDLNQDSVAKTFLRYFDELNGLADLIPVAGHHADVSETPADDAPTRLFLISRSRTEPYTYFWRQYDPVESWSPWQRVDLSIASPEIAAVYAFGRLFLFWAELEDGKTGTIEEANASARYVRAASLHYSFLAVSGQWVQPQVLAASVPTEVAPDSYTHTLRENAAVERALTPSALHWQQPYPLRLPRGLTGTGRVAINAGTCTAAGTGTAFGREVRPGDRLHVGGQVRVVAEVADDITLLVETPRARSARNAAFKVVPLQPDRDGFTPFDGPGSVGITAGLTLVDGYRTHFTKDFQVGDRILCKEEVRTVVLITSDTNMTVDQKWTVDTGTGQSGYVVIPGASGAERVLVIFGGGLPTAAGVDPSPPKVTPNTGRDPFLQQLQAFDQSVFSSAKLAKVAAPSAPGQVPLNYSVVLDQDLQAVSTRMVLTDYSYSAADNPKPYQYWIDRSERVVRVVQNDNPVADNYWGSNVPGTPPPALSGEPHTLLYNTAASASLRNVGNQMGWAIFHNGDEPFLVRSSEKRLRRLSDMAISSHMRDVEPGEALVLSTSAFTDAPAGFQDLSFTFTRLTTGVIPRLRQRLLAGGIDALLTPGSQSLPELPFNRFYAAPGGEPPPRVVPPPDRLDFDGAFGPYFQEMFLFCPWLVAARLQGDQRFEEAKTWYEYVFNPMERSTATDGHPNDRYWRYLPFRNLTLDSLIADLTSAKHIRAYNKHPFDPDAVARLRPGAYPKAVVMGYIDNLLSWADHLFAIDTSESITEATQLYVLASELLGPRPQEVGTCPVPETQDFAHIRAHYDGHDIPQFLIDLENGPPDLMNAPTAFRAVPVNDINAYFCVPENCELITYWDRVDDRLFKIRHCLNLQGVARKLAAYEPPLSPGEVSRARTGTRGQTSTAPPPPRHPGPSRSTASPH